MTKNEEFYLKGRKEGYLDVRIESVLDEKQSIREIYLKAYSLGKQTRKNEELHETEEEKKTYIEMRKSYIIAKGYEEAIKCGWPTANNLKDKDKELYEIGFKTGMLCRKLQKDGLSEFEAYQQQKKLVRDE